MFLLNSISKETEFLGRFPKIRSGYRYLSYTSLYPKYRELAYIYPGYFGVSTNVHKGKLKKTNCCNIMPSLYFLPLHFFLKRCDMVPPLRHLSLQYWHHNFALPEHDAAPQISKPKVDDSYLHIRLSVWLIYNCSPYKISLSISSMLTSDCMQLTEIMLFKVLLVNKDNVMHMNRH